MKKFYRTMNELMHTGEITEEAAQKLLTALDDPAITTHHIIDGRTVCDYGYFAVDAETGEHLVPRSVYLLHNGGDSYDRMYDLQEDICSRFPHWDTSTLSGIDVLRRGIPDDIDLIVADESWFDYLRDAGNEKLWGKTVFLLNEDPCECKLTEDEFPILTSHQWPKGRTLDRIRFAMSEATYGK